MLVECSMFKKRAMARDKLTSGLNSRMKLSISEGRVYGARYLTVLPIIGWDMQQGNWDNISDWSSMEDWCKEQFGPTPVDGVWTPNARWYMNDAKFWFRKEADLSWFLLRWS